MNFRKTALSAAALAIMATASVAQDSAKIGVGFSMWPNRRRPICGYR